MAVIQFQHVDRVFHQNGKEWDRIVARIEPLGILTEADGPALAIYCTAYSRWVRARQLIEAKGLVVDTTDKPRGCLKTNPAVAIAEAAEVAMGRILASFGLTPADRSKVKAHRAAGGKGPADPLEKFQIKRG